MQRVSSGLNLSHLILSCHVDYALSALHPKKRCCSAAVPLLLDSPRPWLQSIQPGVEKAKFRIRVQWCISIVKMLKDIDCSKVIGFGSLILWLLGCKDFPSISQSEFSWYNNCTSVTLRNLPPLKVKMALKEPEVRLLFPLYDLYDSMWLFQNSCQNCLHNWS